jgi:hypothetical protein
MTLMMLKSGADTVANTGWSVFKAIVIVGCVITTIGVIGWLVYAGAIKPVVNPNPTTTQNAQKIENNAYYPEKTSFCLFKLGGLELISWHSYPAKPTTKETIVSEKVEVNTKNKAKK